MKDVCTLPAVWRGAVGEVIPRKSLYLYEVLGPGREDLSGQWSVWCSHLLNLP